MHVKHIAFEKALTRMQKKNKVEIIYHYSNFLSIYFNTSKKNVINFYFYIYIIK